MRAKSCGASDKADSPSPAGGGGTGSPAGTREPVVIVVSGPSGAGKSTVIRRLLETAPRARLSVSATTRPPRPGERHGVDYHFVDEAGFRGMVEAGEFLEHAEVFGRLYGTPRAELARARADGVDLVVEIDVQGARQLRERLPEAVTVFVVPGSPGELERRLTARGTDPPDAVARRLAALDAELAEMPKYDYLVTNDEVDEAVRALRAVLTAERCRPRRTEAWSVWTRTT